MVEIKPGDRVELKKQHPCGGKTFTVEYVGMDISMRCEQCGARIRLLRRDFEKRVKKIL
jgi:hypothetical protein